MTTSKDQNWQGLRGTASSNQTRAAANLKYNTNVFVSRMCGPVLANQMTGSWCVSTCAKDFSGQQHAPEKTLLTKLDAETVKRTFEGASFSNFCMTCVCLRKVGELHATLSSSLFGRRQICSSGPVQRKSQRQNHRAKNATLAAHQRARLRCAHDAVVERVTATVHVVELGLHHEVNSR